MKRAATYIALFVACVLFHSVGTWSLPLIDRDEPRFAEAAREMRERSEWIIPYFNNQFRFDKPPLTYWFQIASYRLFGENDFAARFPTTIAAALVAVALMAWGKRLGEERGENGFDSTGAAGRDDNYESHAAVGWWAAVIFTLCLQTFIHGKAAVADMWLVLFVTLAHWAGWELLHGTSAKKFFWIFYVSLALAFLAKGPIGWIPLITLVIGRRFFPDKNTRLYFFPGILLMLAVVCVWGIPALVRTHGEFFFVGIGKHVIGRSLATMEGHGANSFGLYLLLLPFYFATLFISFFPWSIKLPALWKTLRRERDHSDNLLLLGAIIIFGIFTFVKTKLPHYTLPAFPLLALLLARRAQQLRLSRVLAWGMSALLVALALIAPPIFSRVVPSYVLEQRSRTELRSDMEFAAIGYTEPSLVWYLRRDISGFMTPLRSKDAAAYLEKPGPRFLILPTNTATHLFPQPDASWRSYRTDGWNIAKGERVEVTMLLKPQ
jgi:4-amino-4-deoxy-L-arabinose transferase-like glycosyltransferase